MWVNNYRSIIWRFLRCSFLSFGLLQTLFFARAIFPQFRASGLNTPQTLLCMVSAIILSALYSMICVDGQESLYAIKIPPYNLQHPLCAHLQRSVS